MSRNAQGAPSGPQTCCSTCRTVFQVSMELLQSTDTRVRCGECYAIFDALTNLVDDLADPPAQQWGPGNAATVGGALAQEPGEALAALSGSAEDTSGLDVTYSDFDLFSEDAELPEVAYLDRTRDTPEFDFDSVEPDADESFSDTLFDADDTQLEALPVGGADDPGASPAPVPPDGADTLTGDPAARIRRIERALMPDIEIGEGTDARVALDFRYQDRDPDPDPDPEAEAEAEGEPVPAASEATAGERQQQPSAASLPEPLPELLPGAPAQSPPESPPGASSESQAGPQPLDKAPVRRIRSRALPVVMLLGLCVLLAGLYVHRQRGALHQDPLIRPVYAAVCRVTGCELPLRSALDSIVLEQRRMYSHPTLTDALVIDVVLRNDAAFVQPMPAVSVRLSGPSGRLVARRTFQPAEYLDDPDVPLRMAPGERLRVDLDVDDPGRGASSFVIGFEAAKAGP